MIDLMPDWIVSAMIIAIIIIVGFFIVTLYFRIKRRRRYDLAKISLTDIDKMTGHEFEEYLYVLFIALEYDQTYLTKKSGDFGADLLFSDDNNRKTVVQAKRLADKLGLTAVQEVYTAKAYYEADRAIIITSTNDVTMPCRKLASATEVKIIDRSELGEMIKAFKRGNYSSAIEYIEEPFERISYNVASSYEVIEQQRGMIQAGEYFYKIP